MTRIAALLGLSSRIGWIGQPLKRKEKTTKATKHELPMFQVTLSRVIGKDSEGKDILARPKEIGAAWAGKGGRPGGVVSLDLIPIELTQRQGVLFLLPLSAKDGEAL